MNKIQVTQPTFLINLDNPIEVSYVPMEGNWKSIIVQTYNHGFPEIKDDEILYVYKENRGYIGKHYELNKKYTEDSIEYEYTKLGTNILMGIHYRGDNDPVRGINNFITKKLKTLRLYFVSNRFCFHKWKPSKTRWNSVDCIKCGKHKPIF